MTGMHHLACQPTSRFHLISLRLYFNNWLSFNSKPQNMIIILEFPNGRSFPGRHEICKLRSTEKCQRSHMKVKKTVIQCKCNQSQSVVPYETLPEINLLQVRVPSQKNTRAGKMHSSKPSCYDHLTGEG